MKKTTMILIMAAVIGLAGPVYAGSIDKFAEMAAKSKNMLALVNTQVNQHMVYAEDLVTHGKQEFWDTPENAWKNQVGDCEEYALVKHAVLAKAGLPEHMMKLVKLGDHVVLAVRIGQTVHILDNRTNQIKRVNDSIVLAGFDGYRTVASVFKAKTTVIASR